MPTGKKTKKVELFRNDDLIISPFLFCFFLLLLLLLLLLFCLGLFCFVFFFILTHPRKLWPKLSVTEVTRSRVQCLLKCPHSTVLHNKQKNIRVSERER